MATQLGQLRSKLVRLQSTRKLIRWGNGFSLLATAGVAILIVAFLADWLLDMSRAQRFVLLGLVLVAAFWAFRRFTRPWLKQNEELVELALQVESRQGIDSDLVAAMQFEKSEAKSWGSPDLENAVISQVADLSPKLDVFAGFSSRDFRRRVLIAVGAAALLVGWAVVLPGYFGAFFNRLLLGAGSYPTDTQIVRVEVNGEAVLDKGKVVRRSAPYGASLSFVVTGGGVLPADGIGRIRIESLDGNIATDIEIRSSAAKADEDAEDESKTKPVNSSSTVFRGELPRLMDSVSFRVYLGDARSRPLRIDAIPLPAVDVEIEVTPPDYAKEFASSQSDGRTSRRQLSVIEGSRVELAVRSLNKKLETAKLWIGEDEYALTATDKDQDGRERWSFKVAGTPFESVSEPLKYRIEVTDTEGLSLESPIHGTLRLKNDQAPRTAASLRTRKVVPTASPPVVWTASDDFGLSKVVAQIQIARVDGEVEEDEVEIAASVAGKPRPETLRGEYRLDLEKYKLVKGDELKVMFIAWDYRGSLEPQKSFSEPLILSVTDQQGILSGLLQTDEESAKQLDAIIRRELGIGEK
ncbi:MAG: hypothetical protein H8E37_11060 [Planctomycetes bacterium]|nr:hypothetical protein [Planctomycetota bacterium]